MWLKRLVIFLLLFLSFALFAASVIYAQDINATPSILNPSTESLPSVIPTLQSVEQALNLLLNEAEASAMESIELLNQLQTLQIETRALLALSKGFGMQLDNLKKLNELQDQEIIKLQNERNIYFYSTIGLGSCVTAYLAYESIKFLFSNIFK